MSYYQKTLLTTLIFFIASETSLNAGWKDFFTMPRVALGIAAIGAGSCIVGIATIGGILSHRKQAQEINRLAQQIHGLTQQVQNLKNNAGEELTVCVPRERKEVGSLIHVLSLMATKEELKESFNFFTVLRIMSESQQQIQAIHHDLSQEVESNAESIDYESIDEESTNTVRIKKGPLIRTLSNLKKLSASLDPAKLQQYQVI